MIRDRGSDIVNSGTVIGSSLCYPETVSPDARRTEDPPGKVLSCFSDLQGYRGDNP